MPKGKPSFKIPKIGSISAFAMIIDINNFAGIVRRAETSPDSVAQYTRDVLTGAIMQVEANGGHVVGFMGDAVLALIREKQDVVTACFSIAKNVDRQCEYISSAQKEDSGCWEYAPGGTSLKIAIEYGQMDVSTISSRFLGEQKLVVGNAIIHAVRISRAGRGNRCLVGPNAAKMQFKKYGLEGPFSIAGKQGEPRYKYYEFPMGEIWREGILKEETYWG